MKNKFFNGFVVAAIGLIALVTQSYAHVVVTPNKVGIAAIQVFTISVPTEKDTPTTGLRLLIPNGLKDITPNVKSGWTITEKKQGTGANETVTEIDWEEGSIPSGQQDEFLFKAQAPSIPTTLQWKAYQMFTDGSEIAWNNPPSAHPEDDSAPPPYSITKVINDLSGTPALRVRNPSVPDFPGKGAYILGGIAFLMSAAALALQLRKK